MASPNPKCSVQIVGACQWHLTIRSSRPHVVASAMCFTLRLHTSAAPPRVGLTQALGGRKAFDCFVFQCLLSRLQLTLLFGQVVGTLLLRLLRQARSHMACVALTGFGINEPHRLASPPRTRSFGDGRRIVHEARSSIRAPAFGKCARVRFASASTAT